MFRFLSIYFLTTSFQNTIFVEAVPKVDGLDNPWPPTGQSKQTTNVYGYIEDGTDSGMYNKHLFEGDILLQDSDGKNAISERNRLWSNGAVIFKIADNVGCPYSKRCKIISDAMDVYHRKTCLRFKEWTGEDDFVEIFHNDGNSGACWSVVGRKGGRQHLSLGHRCWYLGIGVHELGHAVGFWHEMNRPDRDNHIYIHWRNILPGFRSSFIKNPPGSVNTLGEPFDLKSIMMYDEYAFSKDGRSPTIQAKSGATIGPIWRKRGLSDSDVRRVQKLYKCNSSKVKDGFPYNFTCEFSSNTCGFKSRAGSNDWKWRKISRSEGYIYTAGNRNSSSSELASVNFHPLENLMNSGSLSFLYFLSGSSSLQVKQEVLNSAADLNRGSPRKLWSSDTPRRGWNRVQVEFDWKKPHRIVFIPAFVRHGTVAIKSIRITPIEYRSRSEIDETVNKVQKLVKDMEAFWKSTRIKELTVNGI